MGKGTAARGRMNSNSTHIQCRRCGSHAYHKTKGVCASCGYGKSAKLRSYNFLAA